MEIRDPEAAGLSKQEYTQTNLYALNSQHSKVAEEHTSSVEALHDSA